MVSELEAGLCYIRPCLEIQKTEQKLTARFVPSRPTPKGSDCEQVFFFLRFLYT